MPDDGGGRGSQAVHELRVVEVDWSLLGEERIRSIPLLQRLRSDAGAGR